MTKCLFEFIGTLVLVLLGDGVQLSLGSDCHRPGQAGCLDWPVAVTRRLGLAAGDQIGRAHV